MNGTWEAVDPAIYPQLFDQLHEGMYLVDRERVITYWNRAAEAITGFSAEEVVGYSCAEHILTHIDASGRRLCIQGCPMLKLFEDGQPRQGRVFVHHKRGHCLEVCLRIAPLRDLDGAVIGGVQLFTDSSRGQAAAERVQALEDVAYLETETALLNRGYIARELDKRLEEYQCFRIPFALLLIKIDRFASLQIGYGDKVCRALLGAVAQTLQAQAGPYDLYGRWDGEAFVGIVRNCSSVQLERLAEQLRILLEQGYLMHEGVPITLTTSIGATQAGPGDGLDPLLIRAERLLQRAVLAGGNRVQIG